MGVLQERMHRLSIRDSAPLVPVPQAALPPEVFSGFVSALKPKQQRRLQEVLSA